MVIKKFRHCQPQLHVCLSLYPRTLWTSHNLTTKRMKLCRAGALKKPVPVLLPASVPVGVKSLMVLSYDLWVQQWKKVDKNAFMILIEETDNK